MGVYVITADGGAARGLSTGESDDAGAPSWSRDGKWVYFGSERTGRPEIWRVPAGGGEPVQVTRTGGGFAVESPDGRFLYYVKPEVAGLWRMNPTGGKESRVLDAPEPAYWGSWVAVDDGIYFVDTFVQPHGAISFYDMVSRRVTRVLVFDREPDSWDVGLAVSPDGRWVLYGLVDSQNSDLVLVENFL
jgi:Tol biopolymer transport system component